jgi:hypothetical protein
MNRAFSIPLVAELSSSTQQNYKHPMSANTKLAAPADLFLQPAERRHRFQKLDGQLVREPKSRLWKLSHQQACHQFTLIESSVLLLLFVIGLAMIGSCFIELSHLLQSDALRRVTVEAMQPAGLMGQNSVTRSFQYIL